MEKFYPILRKSPIFDGISDSELDAILSCLGAKVKCFAKGETILSEGDPANKIGVMLSGSAQIYRLDLSGNRSLMGIAMPCEIFAEAFACADVGRMPASVSALEESHVLLIDAKRITHSCTQACSFHQQMIYNLMRILALKNLACNQKIEITGKRTTRDKLMTYLLMQAKEAGRADFTIPFDRQGLADYLEVDRSGLSAEMSKLKKEGVLDYYKSDFRLMNTMTGE